MVFIMEVGFKGFKFSGMCVFAVVVVLSLQKEVLSPIYPLTPSAHNLRTNELLADASSS